VLLLRYRENVPLGWLVSGFIIIIIIIAILVIHSIQGMQTTATTAAAAEAELHPAARTAPDDEYVAFMPSSSPPRSQSSA
jgi:hypothetical protein